MMKGKFSVKSSKAVKSSVIKPQGWLGCFLPNHSSNSDDFFPFFAASFLLLIDIDRKSCRHEEYWYREVRIFVGIAVDRGMSHGTSCFELILLASLLC